MPAILGLAGVAGGGARRGLRSAPRKSGKTELAAALAIYFMAADGEKSAEVYCAAASEDQADRVFDASKPMVELSDSLSRVVDIQVGRLTVSEAPYSYMHHLTSTGKTKRGIVVMPIRVAMLARSTSMSSRVSKEDAMAFNNVGPLTFLAPGQTAFWSFSYGGDHGTQFASADVKTPNQGAVHLADQQRKEKNNNGNATYFVNITNQGPGGCFHNIQGGGMS